MIETILALVCMSLALAGLAYLLRDDAEVLRARSLAATLQEYARALDELMGAGRPAELSAIPLGEERDVTALLGATYLRHRVPDSERARTQLRAWVRHERNPVTGTERFVGLVATEDFTGTDVQAGRVVKLIGAASGHRSRSGGALLGLAQAWRAEREAWPQVHDGQLAVLVAHGGRSTNLVPAVTSVEYTVRNAVETSGLNPPLWTPLYTSDELDLSWRLVGAERATVMLYDADRSTPERTWTDVTQRAIRLAPKKEWLGRTLYFVIRPQVDDGVAMVDGVSKRVAVERYASAPIERMNAQYDSFSSKKSETRVDEGCNYRSANAAFAPTYYSRLVAKQLILLPRNAALAKAQTLTFLEPFDFKLTSYSTPKDLWGGRLGAGPSEGNNAHEWPRIPINSLATSGEVFRTDPRPGWMHTFITKCHVEDIVHLNGGIEIIQSNGESRRYPVFSYRWIADGQGYNNFREKSFDPKF